MSVPRVRLRRGALSLLFAGLAIAGPGRTAEPAGEPVPVAVMTAPGRFEIAAIDASVAHAVAAEAEGAWQYLGGALGLPEAFSSPVFVRVVATGEGGGKIFDATLEPGGVVSLRLRAVGAPPAEVRRALVHGLLLRLAATLHGGRSGLVVPAWLEEGCLGWWQTREQPALLDAARQASLRGAPSDLAGLLARSRAAPAPAQVRDALWLVAFLQAESGRGREWPLFLQRLLAGEAPEAALAAAYPGRYADARERELWWQTGWYQACRARTLPSLEAADSRVQLEALARFVFALGPDEADTLVPLPGVLGRAREPIVAAELARRVAELDRLIPSLHPFYRNAGLSLAEALKATQVRSAKRREALCQTFEQDWRDAYELESATQAALDAMERGGPAATL